jgi:protein arginine N-methyltransferase 1
MEEQDGYFKSYQDLEIHELMLIDSARNEAYRKAISMNREQFKGKTVMDIGSGTGFLSILAAQASAKKVYAIEASSLAELSREIIRENGFESIIQVHQKRLEDFHLPSLDDQQVDIIISEWMGFYLLHEGSYYYFYY